MDLKRIRLFLFDMDGTLYLGERLFGFTKELLQVIRASGRDYRYLTNNSSKGVGEYVAKLERLGVPAAPEELITSATATIAYLKEHHPHARIYLCGTKSVRRDLENAGFAVPRDPRLCDAVVITTDTELTFQKLDDVCMLLSTRPDLPYIATHPDLICPTEYGYMPDCGSLIELFERATKRLPVVIGKPNPLMVEMGMRALGVTPEETAVVGDRLNTDVLSGIRAHARTILVLSGAVTRKEAEHSEIRPDLVLESGADLLERLKNDR